VRGAGSTARRRPRRSEWGAGGARGARRLRRRSGGGAALTSFGMVERSRPHDRDASRVIALWKDPTKGVREIPLEPGAHGVVLTLCMDRATRRSADGRWPVDNGTSCFDAAVHHVRASSTGSGLPLSRPATPPGKPGTHDSHRLGRGRLGSRSTRTRADRLTPRRGPRRRDMARRARAPGAIAPTRRRDAIARPSRSRGCHPSGRTAIRRTPHGGQPGVPRRSNTRWAGPARVARGARGTRHQTIQPSGYHPLTRPRGSRVGAARCPAAGVSLGWRRPASRCAGRSPGP